LVPVAEIYKLPRFNWLDAAIYKLPRFNWLDAAIYKLPLASASGNASEADSNALDVCGNVSEVSDN